MLQPLAGSVTLHNVCICRARRVLHKQSVQHSGKFLLAMTAVAGLCIMRVRCLAPRGGPRIAWL
jgi:hypothetical protein